MSDESLRKAGRAELDRLNKQRPGAMSDAESRKTSGQLPKKRRTPPPAKPKRATERRFGPEGKDVNEIVSDAVDGAKLSY